MVGRLVQPSIRLWFVARRQQQANTWCRVNFSSITGQRKKLNPAPAGEVPSVTSTADGDQVEPAHDPNNASRAEGNIAELDHAPSIQQPSGRPIMVKFTSYRTRDLVFRAKSKLKTHNSQNLSQKIFINEDLTKFRANLCFEARKLKPHILRDVWTHGGRVLVKDPRNNVKLIRNPHDLQQFQ